eukprot:8270285-Pyramimonas_sp.AAC.1
MIFAIGIHFKLRSGIATARSPAPRETRAPRRRRTFVDGTLTGPPSTTGRSTGASFVLANSLPIPDLSAQ